MRRFLVCLALPIALLAAKAARADTKIGYVDVQRAVVEVDEGKAAKVKLQGEANEARSKVEASQAALNKMKADYDKQASVLADDAKRKKQEELQKSYVEMQQSATELEDGLRKKEQAAMGTIGQKMLQVIAEISEREALTYVVDKSALLFAPPSSDVTNEVIRRYNEKYPSASGAAEGAKSSKSEGTKTAKSGKK